MTVDTVLKAVNSDKNVSSATKDLERVLDAREPVTDDESVSKTLGGTVDLPGVPSTVVRVSDWVNKIHTDTDSSTAVGKTNSCTDTDDNFLRRQKSPTKKHSLTQFKKRKRPIITNPKTKSSKRAKMMAQGVNMTYPRTKHNVNNNTIYTAEGGTTNIFNKQ
ncbi:hypothetical protein SARC_09883 [Sphaeroforma arctica JP610]|uniref:Uncharacterized protein n=1 Tax=Sphaeroforma arctica JP610 TaxID=667725 RepID=A0A0L0FME5_9EUKA|nr:hypothetical protein SARC_09883 [Sphaeroforma arctica JP610]KNC77661.1 hypothetical protein SARC_09883 [Sphaeroforma arctica JP610]|eukprot:XP_014151563.1 hypothetical protein SARC_09883 [Sphaeroforma arctica JP610]